MAVTIWDYIQEVLIQFVAGILSILAVCDFTQFFEANYVIKGTFK